jgi:hypothetical protein
MEYLLMARLFAAHFTEKLTSELVSEEYDSEQELWIGDNQLHGGGPSFTGSKTKTVKGTLHQTRPGVADTDFTNDSDTDIDPDQ